MAQYSVLVFWVLIIATVLWILRAIRDIRDALQQIVQQQAEMLGLQRIWTRFYEQQEEMLRLQRERGREPPPAMDVAPTVPHRG